MSAPGIPVEPDWRAIVEDLEAQVGYSLRRCLAAEGHDGDVVAMQSLVADAEDIGRLGRG